MKDFSAKPLCVKLTKNLGDRIKFLLFILNQNELQTDEELIENKALKIVFLKVAKDLYYIKVERGLKSLTPETDKATGMF